MAMEMGTLLISYVNGPDDGLHLFTILFTSDFKAFFLRSPILHLAPIVFNVSPEFVKIYWITIWTLEQLLCFLASVKR